MSVDYSGRRVVSSRDERDVGDRQRNLTDRQRDRDAIDRHLDPSS